MEREYEESIEQTKKWVAKGINILDAAHEKLEFVFEQKRDWNSEVMYQIEDAIGKLGVVLATLTNWYDFDEQKEEENDGEPKF